MAIGQGRIRMVLSRLLALQGGDQSVDIRQKQLAADLGLSAPVVSMAMTALKKGGYARKNADRSWSVSETPIYDNRDRMDMLLAEVRQLQETKIDALITLVGQLQEKIDAPGKIVQAAWSPTAENWRLQPATSTTAGPMPERAVVCAGRPVPAGRLTTWHVRDDRYPFKSFIADAFAYDARGVVFALRICGTGDDAEPYPVRRGYEPREGDRGDAFIETVDGLADFKTAADLRGGFAARISNAPAGAKLDWTSWLVFVKT